MARGPSLFRQTDVTRFLKGVRAAGIERGNVCMDKSGRIVLELAPSEERTEVNSWDEVLGDAADQNRSS
jgi:hypothetical protein